MENKEKRQISILGTSGWRIMAYFTIYSFIGFIIETLFALIFYNMLECRQSFLYGPFCGIYGVGAVFMYVILNKYFNKNNYTLFFGGMLVGSITEYLLSFLGELIFNVRWWDYSDKILNINGRVCLLYSFFWGLLALYFMKSINPKINQLIKNIKDKINLKIIRVATIICFVLLILDCIISGIAVDLYLTRQVVQNDIDVINKERTVEKYDRIYGNEKYSKIIYKIFSDKKMVITYPNLTVTLKDGTVKKVREYLPGLKYYYFKIR